jgi:type II secretory pathway pseudopilin PulG
MKKNQAITLIEIIIVVIILGILVTMGVVNYRVSVIRAHEHEAQSNLRLIQAAEETYFLERNTYVSCVTPAGGGEADCNSELHLSLPTVNWRYNVAGDNATFSAAASPTGSDLIEGGSTAGAYHILRGEASPSRGCAGIPGCTEPGGDSLPEASEPEGDNL